MVTTKIEYCGGLRSKAVHGPSGTAIDLDAPADIGGGGTTFSPTDLVGAALGGCILTTMAMVAQRRGIELAGAQAEVVKHMTSDKPRRIACFDVAIRLSGEVPGDVRALLARAARLCPVHASLAPEVTVNLTFQYD